MANGITHQTLTNHELTETKWNAEHVGATGRGATFIVAGSNAPSQVIAQADYTCDGTADDVQIQEALDALTAARTHKEVVKFVGDFTITAPIIVPSYTVLDRREAKFTLADDSDCAMWETCDIYDTTHPASTDIEIIGGIDDGNKTNQTSNWKWFGLFFFKTSNLLISGVTVQNTCGYGIFTRDLGATVANKTIENCYIYGCDGIDVDTDYLGATTIKNCTCEYNLYTGIMLFSTYGARVTDCTCNNNGFDGIGIIQDSNRNIIKGCYCHNNTLSGIAILTNDATYYCYHNVIEDCVIEANGTTDAASSPRLGAISIDRGIDTILSHLIIKENYYHGIYLAGGNTRTKITHCFIYDNGLRTAGLHSGIYAVDNGGLLVQGNTILDDISPNNHYCGAELAGTGSTNLRFYDNNISGYVFKAIYWGDAPAASQIPKRNLGYISENTGVASNVTLDGSGIGVIAHGCDKTPIVAFVQCQSENFSVRISSIDATNINILVQDLAGSVVTADTHDFYWKAEG